MLSSKQRLILHVGLLKSATTHLQSRWLADFGEPGPVWYPDPIIDGPSHSGVYNWLVQNQDESYWMSLPEILDRAKAHETNTLILSSESFDHIDEKASKYMHELFVDWSVTVLVTLRKPADRYVSGWVELVKHGLAEGQSQSIDLIRDYVLLHRGSISSLLRTLNFDEVKLALVKSEFDSSLYVRLLDLLNITYFADDLIQENPIFRNQSIGMLESELLIALHRELHRWKTLGIRATKVDKPVAASVGLISALVDSESWKRLNLNRSLEVSPDIQSLMKVWAEEEELELRNLVETNSISLNDPDGLLMSWR